MIAKWILGSVFALWLAPLALAQSITVLTHDSFSLPAAVVEEFERSTGIDVVFLPAGDAGEVVNRAILTKARPLADVLYGIDDSLLERARAEGIFEPYESPELQRVPEAYRFDPEFLVTPIDVGHVTVNLDLAWFEENEHPLPTDLTDLSTDFFGGLSVVENPASSSPGLAFLLATVARYGDPAAGLAPGSPGEVPAFTDYLDYWAALRDADVLVVDGWTDAYYTAFTRYGGDRPIVVSYATSPAAEVIFAETPLDEAPTANLECPQCSYQQIEAAGILAGTRQRAAAEAFIDFLLSRAVQEAIPMEMFVYPVRDDAALPDAFVRFSPLPARRYVATLPSALVQAHQRRWVSEWTAVVLQSRTPDEVRSRRR
ncbi:MAG: thiamine ABC transporter substrate-binding protein [Trueperaceae bacterium]